MGWGEAKGWRVVVGGQRRGDGRAWGQGGEEAAAVVGVGVGARQVLYGLGLSACVMSWVGAVSVLA